MNIEFDIFKEFYHQIKDILNKIKDDIMLTDIEYKMYKIVINFTKEVTNLSKNTSNGQTRITLDTDDVNKELCAYKIKELYEITNTSLDDLSRVDCNIQVVPEFGSFEFPEVEFSYFYRCIVIDNVIDLVKNELSNTTENLIENTVASAIENAVAYTSRNIQNSDNLEGNNNVNSDNDVNSDYKNNDKLMEFMTVVCNSPSENVKIIDQDDNMLLNKGLKPKKKVKKTNILPTSFDSHSKINVWDHLMGANDNTHNIPHHTQHHGQQNTQYQAPYYGEHHGIGHNFHNTEHNNFYNARQFKTRHQPSAHDHQFVSEPHDVKVHHNQYFNPDNDDEWGRRCNTNSHREFKRDENKFDNDMHCTNNNFYKSKELDNDQDNLVSFNDANDENDCTSLFEIEEGYDQTSLAFQETNNEVSLTVNYSDEKNSQEEDDREFYSFNESESDTEYDDDQNIYDHEKYFDQFEPEENDRNLSENSSSDIEQYPVVYFPFDGITNQYEKDMRDFLDKKIEFNTL